MAENIYRWNTTARPRWHFVDDEQHLDDLLQGKHPAGAPGISPDDDKYNPNPFGLPDGQYETIKELPPMGTNTQAALDVAVEKMLPECEEQVAREDRLDQILAKYDTSSLQDKPGKNDNWIEGVGGQLPPFVRAVAHALIRNGHAKSQAIQIAIGTIKRWAAGGGDVSAKTRAKAAATVAEWEKLKAKAAAT